VITLFLSTNARAEWLATIGQLRAFVRTKGAIFTSFLQDKQNTLLELSKRQDSIRGLAYLADIFNHMNETNLSIQGPEVTITDATEKLQTFFAKLSMWKKRVDTASLQTFRCWRKCFIKIELIQNSQPVSLKTEIREHLETLQNSFKVISVTYSIKVEPWIRSPFLSDIICIEYAGLAKEELTDLRTKTYYNWSLIKKPWKILVFLDRSLSSPCKASYKLNSVALVRKRTIPTERPPLSAK
jgi:hypothetical protein